MAAVAGVAISSRQITGQARWRMANPREGIRQSATAQHHRDRLTRLAYAAGSRPQSHEGSQLDPALQMRPPEQAWMVCVWPAAPAPQGAGEFPGTTTKVAFGDGAANLRRGPGASSEAADRSTSVL